MDHKVLEITFTEDVGRKALEQFGRLREHSRRRVVIETPSDHTKEVAADILTHLPVDDILINEPEVDDVIRKIFLQKQKKDPL